MPPRIVLLEFACSQKFLRQHPQDTDRCVTVYSNPGSKSFSTSATVGERATKLLPTHGELDLVYCIYNDMLDVTLPIF